jgi:hypothetical protein
LADLPRQAKRISWRERLIALVLVILAVTTQGATALERAGGIVFDGAKGTVGHIGRIEIDEGRRGGAQMNRRFLMGTMVSG